MIQIWSTQCWVALLTEEIAGVTEHFSTTENSVWNLKQMEFSQ